MPDVRQQISSQTGSSTVKATHNQANHSVVRPHSKPLLPNPPVKPLAKLPAKPAQPAFGLNKPSNKDVRAADQPTFGFKAASQNTAPNHPGSQNISSNHPTFGFSTADNLPVNPGVGLTTLKPVAASDHPTFGFNKPDTKTNPSSAKPVPLFSSPPPQQHTATLQPLFPSQSHQHYPAKSSVFTSQPQPQPLILGVVQSCPSVMDANVSNKKTTEKRDYKKELEIEVHKKLPNEKIEFKVMTCGQKNKYYLATVQVGTLLASSYPQELVTSEAAVQHVAMNALKMLSQLPTDPRSFPVTPSPDVYIPRVKQLVTNTVAERGQVWHTRVEELYQETHKERLPEDWVKETEQKMDEFELKVEKLCDNRYALSIVSRPSTPVHPSAQPHPGVASRPPSESGYAAEDDGSREGNGYICEHSSLATSEEPERMPENGSEVVEVCEGTSEGDSKFPPLILPSGPFWDVFVMYIEDLNNICLRLVGEDYSTAYDDLLTELELHYMEDKNLSPVQSPVVGGIYAASHEESWFRVKLLEVIGKEANVLFVDNGDTELLELANLHNLQDRFYSLPAQCIRCCLAGLEYACSDPSALALLQELAVGQTLVGQIVRTGPGSRISRRGCKEPQPLVLYNTAGDDDININEKIADHLAKNFPEPTLPPVGGVAEVYLKHASSNGDIFVEVNSSTFHILDNLLQLARNRTEEMLGEGQEIDITRLYLAQFSHDGEWYRAAPKGAPENGKVLMYYVDFGNCDYVPLTNIRPLATSGYQLNLNKIPHQALRCRLHNVPGTPDLKWTHRASQRLAELAPDEAPMLLKVQKTWQDGMPPEVELFKRIQPQNELVSINATLSLDTALFSDGDSNNNDVEKIVFSPTRSRSRQSSSNSQGHSSGPSSLGSLPASPRSDDSQVLPVLPSPVVPTVGDYYDVVVTYAANPSNFAVQSWKMSQKLSNLFSEMQKYYATSGNSKVPTKVISGNYFAVRHSDNLWYRALVSMVEQDMVMGLFVDYGDCFWTTPDNVRLLHPSFCKLPCQAIKAKLHGIEAKNKDWTTDDTRRFQELVEYQEFVSAVMGKVEGDDGTVHLSLYLVDTSDPKVDVHIHQVLVEEGHALFSSSA